MKIQVLLVLHLLQHQLLLTKHKKHLSKKLPKLIKKGFKKEKHLKIMQNNKILLLFNKVNNNNHNSKNLDISLHWRKELKKKLKKISKYKKKKNRKQSEKC